MRCLYRLHAVAKVCKCILLRAVANTVLWGGVSRAWSFSFSSRILLIWRCSACTRIPPARALVVIRFRLCSNCALALRHFVSWTDFLPSSFNSSSSRVHGKMSALRFVFCFLFGSRWNFSNQQDACYRVDRRIVLPVLNCLLPVRPQGFLLSMPRILAMKSIKLSDGIPPLKLCYRNHCWRSEAGLSICFDSFWHRGQMINDWRKKNRPYEHNQAHLYALHSCGTSWEIQKVL